MRDLSTTQKFLIMAVIGAYMIGFAVLMVSKPKAPVVDTRTFEEKVQAMRLLCYESRIRYGKASDLEACNLIKNYDTQNENTKTNNLE